jgi:hypothetical protein
MQLLMEWKPASSASQSQRGLFLQNVLDAFRSAAEAIFVDVINDMVSGTPEPKYTLEYDTRAGGAKVRDLPRRFRTPHQVLMLVTC